MSTQKCQTKNTALAAYLLSEGFEPTFEVTSKKEVIFVFGNNSPKLKSLITSYNKGTAMVNAKNFYHNYRRLIAELNRKKNWQEADA
jgi:hypothetical protein